MQRAITSRQSGIAADNDQESAGLMRILPNRDLF